jgi:peptidoglycan hydrolase-like protein with peptidoglycan-binding domain
LTTNQVAASITRGKIHSNDKTLHKLTTHAHIRELQERYGNHSTQQLMRAVALQTQPTPKAKAVTGPLSDKQMKKARRYYRIKSRQFTQANIKRIQKKLGINESGVMDEATLQAIGSFQEMCFPSTPDGIAGAKTILAMFPFGLAKDPSIEKYAADARRAVGTWAAQRDKNKRAQMLIQLVNKRLKAAGVPDCSFKVTKLDYAGQFDGESWTISLSDELLSKPQISTDDASSVAHTVYHEARHAEQYFTVARYFAGRGKSAKWIAWWLSMKKSVVEQAHGSPLSRSSLEAVAAKGLYESMYRIGRVGAKSKRLRIGMDRSLQAKIRLKKLYDQAEKSHKTLFDSYQSQAKPSARLRKRVKAAAKRKHKLRDLLEAATKSHNQWLIRFNSEVLEEHDANRQEQAVMFEYLNPPRETKTTGN